MQPGSALDFRWTWYVSKEGWQGSVNVGPGDFSVSQPMLIYFEDYVDTDVNVFGKLLGYSKPDFSSGTLSRILPFKHPLHPWAVCTRVANVRFLTPEGKEEYDAGPFMSYAWAVLDLVFGGVNYKILSDSQMNTLGLAEYERFVERTNKSRTNAIQRTQGEMTYVDGPPTGEKVPFPPVQWLSKVDIVWLWRDVAEGFVLSDTTKLPTNIYAARNHVNKFDWHGFPAGTLLMQDPDIRPRMLPTHPENLGLGVLDVPRSYDISISMSHFDPPAGGDFYGHNLTIWPGDGLWYLVTDEGGNFIYPEIDFDSIWLPAN
jgi:hypothetical protein